MNNTQYRRKKLINSIKGLELIKAGKMLLQTNIRSNPPNGDGGIHKFGRVFFSRKV